MIKIARYFIHPIGNIPMVETSTFADEKALEAEIPMPLSVSNVMPEGATELENRLAYDAALAQWEADQQAIRDQQAIDGAARDAERLALKQSCAIKFEGLGFTRPEIEMTLQASESDLFPDEGE